MALTILGEATVGLLSVARNVSFQGIGLSNRARQQTDDFIRQSQSGGNALFSAGLNNTGNTEILTTQINAIRASLGIDNEPVTLDSVSNIDQAGQRINVRV